jgi:hypothetical protein
MVKGHCYRVAGRTVEVCSDDGILDSIPPGLERFAAAGAGAGYLLSLDIQYGTEADPPYPAISEWIASKKNGHDRGESSPEFVQEQEAGWLAFLDRATGHCKLFTARACQERAYLRVIALFLRHRIPLSSGTFVHGAGIEIDGRALLFPAPGGLGKTTLSRKAAERRFRILSDDQVFVARGGDSFMMHGTPFGQLSDGPFAGPIGGIFFLKWGRETSFSPLTVPQAFVRAWPDSLYRVIVRDLDDRLIVYKNTLADSEGRKKVFAQWCDLFASSPCYEMTFAPDFDDWDILLERTERV